MGEAGGEVRREGIADPGGETGREPISYRV